MKGSSTLDRPPVSVVVDNDSWVLPWAEELVRLAGDRECSAKLCRNYVDIAPGSIAFFLGCTGLCPKEILARSQANLVVHASDLPKDRGFSPWTWNVLRGHSELDICLLHAAEDVDSGPVVYREKIKLDGHELVDELRAIIGAKTIELAVRYLSEPIPPIGEQQLGVSNHLRKRTLTDSELDPNKTIREQFNLMRVVDNQRYPAFFELHGHRYVLTIRKERTTPNV